MVKNKEQEFVSIGKIMTSHGVTGFAKIFPLTDYPERFEQLKRVFLCGGDDDTYIKTKVESVRYMPKTILLKLDYFDSPEKVKEHKGYLIKIPRQEMLELPEDTFYIDELKGLSVYSFLNEKEYLGEIIGVYSDANDLLEIRTPLNKEVLVPFVKDIVIEVDLKHKKVIVNPISGLF